MRFSIALRLRSFRHALRGIATLVSTQHNAWIHLVATIAVVALGAVFRISRGDWCWLIASFALVWMAEAFNTALEFLADEVSMEQRERIGRAKDLGAAAVLFAAIAAAVIGIVVLGPHVVASIK